MSIVIARMAASSAPAPVATTPAVEPARLSSTVSAEVAIAASGSAKTMWAQPSVGYQPRQPW